MKKQQYDDEIDERELEFVAGGRCQVTEAMMRDVIGRETPTAQQQTALTSQVRRH